MLYRQVLAALEEADAKYVVVGGMAALLHGVAHEPRDLDIVVDRHDAADTGRISGIMASQNFWPTIPLELSEVVVLRFVHPEGAEIDVFAIFHVPFSELNANSRIIPVDGINVRVASLDDLIRAKEATGRPSDQRDAAELRAFIDRRTVR